MQEVTCKLVHDLNLIKFIYPVKHYLIFTQVSFVKFKFENLLFVAATIATLTKILSVSALGLELLA